MNVTHRTSAQLTRGVRFGEGQKPAESSVAATPVAANDKTVEAPKVVAAPVKPAAPQEAPAAKKPQLSANQLSTLTSVFGNITGLDILLAVKPAKSLAAAKRADSILWFSQVNQTNGLSGIQKGLAELEKQGLVEFKAYQKPAPKVRSWVAGKLEKPATAEPVLNSKTGKSKLRLTTRLAKLALSAVKPEVKPPLTKVVLTPLGVETFQVLKAAFNTDYYFRAALGEFKDAGPAGHMAKVNVQYSQSKTDEAQVQIATVDDARKKLMQQTAKLRTDLGAALETEILARQPKEGEDAAAQNQARLALANLILLGKDINAEGQLGFQPKSSVFADGSFNLDGAPKAVVPFIQEHRKLEQEYVALGQKRAALEPGENTFSGGIRYWQKQLDRANNAKAHFINKVATLFDKKD